MNTVALLAREFGIHPKNGRLLVAAGYVLVNGEPVRRFELGAEHNGKTLSVLGRQHRVVIPTMRAREPDPPADQGVLF